MSDPRAALAEVGVDVPAGSNIKVIEDTADTHHIVLPAKPDLDGEMAIEDLAKVAGGLSMNPECG